MKRANWRDKWFDYVLGTLGLLCLVAFTAFFVTACAAGVWAIVSGAAVLG